MNLNVIDLKVSFLEFFFMGIFVYYTYFKITNNNITFNKIGIYILIAIISVTIIIVRNKVNNFIGFVLWFFLLSLMNCKIEKSNIGYAMLVTIIALSINYILLVIEIAFLYLINHFYVIKNDYANLMIMMVMHCILLYFTLKIKRIQNGISFLNKKANHEYFDVIILDASVCILFSIIIFSSRKNVMISRSLFVGFIIFAIVVCITIQKSIQL